MLNRPSSHAIRTILAAIASPAITFDGQYLERVKELVVVTLETGSVET
jgi:hypothetical protein